STSTTPNVSLKSCGRLKMEAKTSSAASEPETVCSSQSPTISKDLNFRRVSETFDLFRVMGTNIIAPEHSNIRGFFDGFLRSFIKVDHIQRGRIASTVVVKGPICNGFGTLHGGAVGSLVVILCTACARTVIPDDKELFLGGLAMSYLSSTPINEEVLANASVVKSGRNLTVVALEFKRKKTGNLIYNTHATFYNMPVARRRKRRRRRRRRGRRGYDMGEKAKNVCASPSLKISKEVDPKNASNTLHFVDIMGAAIPVPRNCNARGYYDAFLRPFIKLDFIQRGRISCTVVAKPPICNGYGTLHGGSVGSLVEVLSTACARTVVAEDKELFLGEMSISYLSATPVNEEVLANASVVKTGRNLTVVALEFKLKKTGNLVYITHSTFFNMPVSSL
ncbi:putative esterase F42H10.6, partial [Mucuna pruriens]